MPADYTHQLTGEVEVSCYLLAPIFIQKDFQINISGN